MSKYGTTFASIEAPIGGDRPSPETVGITIEITGLKSAPQIAVWVADEIAADIKGDARLRAGIVDALADFLDRITGVQ